MIYLPKLYIITYLYYYNYIYINKQVLFNLYVLEIYNIFLFKPIIL